MAQNTTVRIGTDKQTYNAYSREIREANAKPKEPSRYLHVDPSPFAAFPVETAQNYRLGYADQ